MSNSRNICPIVERDKGLCTLCKPFMFLKVALVLLLAVCIFTGVAHRQIAQADDFVTQSPIASDIQMSAIAQNVTTDVATDAPQAQTVWRMYNKTTSEHLWTTDASEYNSLTQHGWTQEGRGWDSLKSGNFGTGVYRLYNAGLGEQLKMSHHYTTDLSEAYNLVANEGWEWDNNGRPLFYSTLDSYSNALSGSVAVYRLYNSALSAHHQTTSTDERDNLIAYEGWTDEGKMFYAFNDATCVTTDSKGVATVADVSNGNRLMNVEVVGSTLNTASASTSTTIATAIKGATVNVNSDGSLKINFPKGAESLSLVITVTYANTSSTPATNKKLTIINADGTKYNEGTTNENGVWQSEKEPQIEPIGIYIVEFITYDGDKAPIEAQTIQEGEYATKPADPTREGYTFDGWYSDETLEHLFDFATQITSNITLYAKWAQKTTFSPKPTGEVTYWMASVPKDNTKVDAMSCWEAVSADSSKIYKDAKQIQADVVKIKRELASSNGKLDSEPNPSTQPTTYEYYQYMINDNVHLYTTYGSNTEDWVDYVNFTVDSYTSNKYAEFRIINVGSHQYSTTEGYNDESTLTFHATHMLPAAYQMNGTRTNEGGWKGSELFSKLQENGEIYTKFNSAFTSDITPTTKAYRAAYNDENSTTTSNDVLWLLSYSEIASNCLDTYAKYAPVTNEEGARYQYFSITETNGYSSNDHLKYTTRAGASPKGSPYGIAFWWLRSPRTNLPNSFLDVLSNGVPGSYYFADYSLGISPAFCF